MTVLMVDRATPPSFAEYTMLKANGVQAIGGYVGGVNNGGRAWKPNHHADARSRGFLMLPIYVGENTCPGCKTPLALTTEQGTTDGNDAVRCAHVYGYASGPLCLDVEYDTYMQNVAACLAYMEAWTFAVAAGGFLPVLYAVTSTARDYQPRDGHPTGLWIANWDNAGDLSKFPNPTRFHGIGWQYADNWNAFDVSHVDGAWWTTPVEMGVNIPAVKTAEPYVDDETGKKIQLGFLDFWNSLNDNQVNYRILGRPLTDEFTAKVLDNPQEYTYQCFEHVVLTWRGGNTPPWDRYAVGDDEAAAVREYAKTNGKV